MSDLLRQRDSFKKKIAAQPVYAKPTTASAATTPIPSKTSTPVTVASSRSSQINRYTPSSIYSATTLDTTHVNSKIHGIIEHLKAMKNSQTAEQIQLMTGIVIQDNPTILDQLKNNPKVTYDKETDTFAYKPEYDLRTNDDLLKLLKSNKDKGGIKVEQLKDSFLDIPKAAMELKAQGKIFTIDKKDNKPRALFFATPPFIDPIDQEIKSIWNELRVPDEADLQAELENANMKPIRVEAPEIVHDEKKKKNRQSNRKVKITNTHLKDIDLTKDFDPII